MKIRTKRPYGQVCRACIGVVIILLLHTVCSGRSGETLVTAPPTSPLTQPQIGFGVVNVSFTRINSEPDENSISLGHLRRATVVRIIERRMIIANGRAESWLLVEEAVSGWLRESLVDIYDNELQARTAANSM